jgi:uncharacterized protein YdiU (UPF0061 family)
VPKGWLLDEVIQRVEHEGDRDVLPNIMKMTLDPYADSWTFEKGDAKKAKDDAERFCGDVPKYKEKPQCSCSS